MTISPCSVLLDAVRDQIKRPYAQPQAAVAPPTPMPAYSRWVTTGTAAVARRRPLWQARQGLCEMSAGIPDQGLEAAWTERVGHLEESGRVVRLLRFIWNGLLLFVTR